MVAKKPFGQNLNRPNSSRPSTKRPGPSCQSIRLKRGGEQFTLSLLIFFPAFCRLCPACHSCPVGLNGGGSLPYVGEARRRSSLLSVNKIGLLATKVFFWPTITKVSIVDSRSKLTKCIKNLTLWHYHHVRGHSEERPHCLA